jgi:hypothetical protein
MKFYNILIILLCCSIANSQCVEEGYINFIKISKCKDIKTRKLAFYDSDRNINDTGNLFIEGNKNISPERFVHKKYNDGIYFPFYYTPELDDVFILSEDFSYFRINKDFSKFIESYVIPTNYSSKIKNVITIKKTRKWQLIEYNYEDVHVLELEMTIGYYNKKTFGSKIIGDFDKFIKVKFIL